MTRDLVFISYSQHDKTWKDAVVALLKGYERRGHFRVWDDDYIQLGDDWRREIDDALAHTRAAVLLVSPDFVRSDFIMDVEVPALLAAVKEQQLFLCCIAVRSVDPDLVPELTQYQWWGRPEAPVDRLSQAEREEQLVSAMKALVKRFRAWTAPPVLQVIEAAAQQEGYAASVGKLILRMERGILNGDQTAGGAARAAGVALDPTTATGNGRPVRRGAPPPLAPNVQALPHVDPSGSAKLHGVPELPPHFVPRAEALTSLKLALLEQPQQAFGIAAPGREGLHGQGGIGKTVLAVALARDAEVQRAFGDGIYWLTLGQTPDVVGLQRKLYHQQSGAWIELESHHAGTSVLRERLVGSIVCSCSMTCGRANTLKRFNS